MRFTGFIPPLCTIVLTLSSRTGTFYSPVLVSDILTRSHKTCHGRKKRRQNARIPESAHKEKQTTPVAIPITHNHVSAAHYTLLTCMHALSHIRFVTMYIWHKHTCTVCQEGPLGSSHGRSQQKADKVGWICLIPPSPKATAAGGGIWSITALLEQVKGGRGSKWTTEINLSRINAQLHITGCTFLSQIFPAMLCDKFKTGIFACYHTWSALNPKRQCGRPWSE